MASIQLVGVERARGVDLPSQSRRRQASQQTSFPPPALQAALIHVSGWEWGREKQQGLGTTQANRHWGPGMPGIWPEETARTTTPLSFFIPLDVLLFHRTGRPGISALSPVTLESF